MTSAQQNPSLSRNQGLASRRSLSGRAGGDLHSTEGQGVPGDRMRQAGAGDKLANQHAAQSGSEALACSCAPMPSLPGTFPP